MHLEWNLFSLDNQSTSSELINGRYHHNATVEITPNTITAATLIDADDESGRNFRVCNLTKRWLCDKIQSRYSNIPAAELDERAAGNVYAMDGLHMSVICNQCRGVDMSSSRKAIIPHLL